MVRVPVLLAKKFVQSLDDLKAKELQRAQALQTKNDEEFRFNNQLKIYQQARALRLKGDDVLLALETAGEHNQRVSADLNQVLNESQSIQTVVQEFE